MQYSLICPTRDRPVERERFLKSIQDTINDVRQTEIIFVIDNDDNDSGIHLEQLIKRFRSLNIVYYKRNRSVMLNADYYNWGAGHAIGKYIWIVGDDVVFQSKDWDTYISPIIENYLEDKPDRVVCVSAKDNTPVPCKAMPKFPCFPILTKEAITAMGFALPSNIPTWGADYVLYKIYKGVDRLLEIFDRTFLNHISYHTKQVSEDAINRRIGTIFNQLKTRREYNTDRIIAEDVPRHIEYLKSVISGRIKLV